MTAADSPRRPAAGGDFDSHHDIDTTVFAEARARFTGLQGDFVFLDAPGGTQTPDEVGDAVAQLYREASGNTGAPYATSQKLEAVVDAARAETARFIGCASDEVIFGGSMTALNFMLSRTLGRQLRRGDEIVVTRLDHDGNVAPWLDLARDLDLVVRHVDVHPDTTLDLLDLERRLTPRTKVVAFPWAANSVGTIVDARAVCDLAHQAGALAWVDAVQYAPHEPMDVRAVGVDVLTCSAYKFCGPHLGIAYGRRDLLESWQPYKARPVSTVPVGHSFETGTLQYELLSGLLAAFAYMDSLGGMGPIAAWERQLGQRLLAGLPPTAKLYGLPSMSGRVPTFLVNFSGVPSAWLSEELAARGFGVWSHGSYYALGLHERIGWGEALRIGLAHYNTLDEIDRFNEVLADLVAAPNARGTSPGAAVLASVVQTADARADRTPGGATIRMLLDTSSRSDGQSEQDGLIRRLVEIPAGSHVDGQAGPAGELCYVLDGTGHLTIAGHPDQMLEASTGLLLAPGSEYRLTAQDQAGLRLDVVSLPADASRDSASRPGPAATDAPVIRALHECEVEKTGDRQFRVLFGPGFGWDVATQFVGDIPPGRAPDHSHPYDEVVLVLAGDGVAHVGGTEHRVSAGTCLHLPPGQPHCMENTGTTTMRVLGVFHPADSPAAKT